MRIFYLYRSVDATGISGTGIVAEGVEFTDGTCALRWLTDITSTAVYDSLTALEAIHGHQGRTRVVDATGAALRAVAPVEDITTVTPEWYGAA